MNATASTALFDALVAVGFELPPDCCDVEMVMPIDGAVQLRFTTHVGGERLAQLSKAFALCAEAQLREQERVQALIDRSVVKSGMEILARSIAAAEPEPGSAVLDAAKQREWPDILRDRDDNHA